MFLFPLKFVLIVVWLVGFRFDNVGYGRLFEFWVDKFRDSKISVVDLVRPLFVLKPVPKLFTFNPLFCWDLCWELVFIVLLLCPVLDVWVFPLILLPENVVELDVIKVLLDVPWLLDSLLVDVFDPTLRTHILEAEFPYSSYASIRIGKYPFVLSVYPIIIPFLSDKPLGSPLISNDT